MNLRCFVAMGFDHNDTDKVYDTLIVKALRKFNIKPVRIDRKEHNNDIDNEIISELKKCDLIISDLTYARPSVYFEAGFGVGRFFKEMKTDTVPVIYTCRRDHFKPREDDQFGNLRIHFDLQMKNIIPWSNPTDKQFLQKLIKRVRFVTSPLVHQREIDEEAIKKIKKFTGLSSSTKIKLIHDKSITQYRKFGYISLIKQQNNLREEKPDFWKGIKSKKGTITEIILYITPSLTKTSIIDLHHSELRFPRYDINPQKNCPLTHLREQMVICSFNKVNPVKIMEYLPDFHYDENERTFTLSTIENVPIRRLSMITELHHSDYEKNYVGILKKPRKYDKTEEYTKEGSYLIKYVETPKTYESKRVRVVKLKKIPRTISIKIIDNIRFEDEFVGIQRNILHNLQS